MTRECGTCTKCCDGWLHGEAHGHNFWPGRPCHFVGEKGCTIYETRPDSPCKSYKCMWLQDETSIPEWMKPDKVNAILTKRRINNIDYIELVEAGEVLRSDVLSWAIQYALNNELGISYQIKGFFNKIGSTEFLKANT